MLKLLPSVIWCLLYFISSAGCWTHLSCGKMIYFRCLPSLCQGQALAWSNCLSGYFLVAFGRLCSHCGFCGSFHQAVWSLSEARACQTNLFESMPVLFPGRWSQISYILKCNVLLVHLAPVSWSHYLWFYFTVKILQFPCLSALPIFNSLLSKFFVGKMERFCCST